MRKKPTHYKAPSIACGEVVGLRRSIAIAFDENEFARIKAIAIENNVAFAEMVRRLCARKTK